MKCQAFLGAILSVSLLGCAGGPRQTLNPPQLVTDSETDMAIQLFMQASILFAKYYGFTTIHYQEIQEKSARAGYITLPFMPPITRRATPPLANFTVQDPIEFRTWVEANGGYPLLAKYYIKTGWKASQLICRNHLLGLDERNQYLEFLQRELGVAFTLGNAILAVANANATLAKTFAISQNAADNAINTYQEYRFLNIDRESARVLVETAQNKYADFFLKRVDKEEGLIPKAAIYVSGTGFTFSDALNAVSTIEYQCTRPGIRNLLNRAINNTPTNMSIDDATGTVFFISAKDKTTKGN